MFGFGEFISAAVAESWAWLHVVFGISGIIAGCFAFVWPGQTFLSLAGVTASLFGICAATIIVLIATLSIRYVRRRLSYEAWHAVHIGLYLAIVLGLVHQALEGTTFKSSPLAALYWWGLWAFVLGSLVTGRIVLPLWRNAYHQFRVAEVVVSDLHAHRAAVQEVEQLYADVLEYSI